MNTHREPPRCYDHKTRETLPSLCHVCQRIAVEQDIAERACKALLAAGYRLAVHNGEDDDATVVSYDAKDGLQSSVERVLGLMFATDDEYLFAYKVERAIVPDDNRPDAWVRFVYGNDGYDVISDYSMNIDTFLKPVNDYADTLA